MTSAFTKDSVTPEERRYAEAAEDHLPLVKMLCRRFAPLPGAARAFALRGVPA